jgi:hypothetical protein
VLQDIGSFEQAQETLALLKLLAMSQADVAAGRLAPVEGLAENGGAKVGHGSGGMSLLRAV